jgi:hypothetical protein
LHASFKANWSNLEAYPSFLPGSKDFNFCIAFVASLIISYSLLLAYLVRGIAISKEEGLARVRFSDGEVSGEETDVAIF